MKTKVLCIAAIMCLLFSGCSSQGDVPTSTQAGNMVNTTVSQKNSKLKQFSGLWYWEVQGEYLLLTENGELYSFFDSGDYGRIRNMETGSYDVSNGFLSIRWNNHRRDDAELKISGNYIEVDGISAFQRIVSGIGVPSLDITGRWETPSGLNFIFWKGGVHGSVDYIEFFSDGTMVWDGVDGGQYSFTHDGAYLYLQRDGLYAWETESESIPVQMIGENMMLFSYGTVADWDYDENGEMVVNSTYDLYLLLVRQ